MRIDRITGKYPDKKHILLLGGVHGDEMTPNAIKCRR